MGRWVPFRREVIKKKSETELTAIVQKKERKEKNPNQKHTKG